MSAEVASEHRAKCTDSKNQAESNKSQREGTLEEKRTEKTRLEEIRQAENALFTDRKADHENAVEAL
jgi:hypothetical protein